MPAKALWMAFTLSLIHIFIVQFVVNKDGSIVDAKVVRSVDPYLDKQALRVINTMPQWKPGIQRGKPVRVQFTVPIMFRLQ